MKNNTRNTRTIGGKEKNTKEMLNYRMKLQKQIVPTRSPGVMTCPASDSVGRAQQGTWTRERGMVQKCT